MKTLRQALENDRTKSDVVEMSQRLGLVQMTRQNVTDGVREILTKMCPTCTGEGVVLSEESVALEVERKLRDLALERRGAEAFLVQVNPRVTAVLINGPGRPLAHLETEVDRHFHFEGSEGLPLEHFDVVMEGTRAQVEERALPFREGEEVLVAIDEPHMYNEDDAVAKVDGYVITVAAAGRHIGEKRLVRIERVGRTAASGSLVENGAGPAQETGAESPDEEVGRARRRGRRGGRGRGTRDRAEAAAEAGE
jgi:ribonuclease G